MNMKAMCFTMCHTIVRLFKEDYFVYLELKIRIFRNCMNVIMNVQVLKNNCKIIVKLL